MDAASGDLRLQSTSPAIDTGGNAAVFVATDLDGHPRRTDVTAVADTGNGTAPIVDMGAYEYHSRSLAIAKLAPTVVAGTPLTYTRVLSHPCEYSRTLASTLAPLRVLSHPCEYSRTLASTLAPFTSWR